MATDERFEASVLRAHKVWRYWSAWRERRKAVVLDVRVDVGQIANSCIGPAAWCYLAASPGPLF